MLIGINKIHRAAPIALPGVKLCEKSSHNIPLTRATTCL
jgi:hypothetical protein